MSVWDAPPDRVLFPRAASAARGRWRSPVQISIHRYQAPFHCELGSRKLAIALPGSRVMTNVYNEQCSLPHLTIGRTGADTR